MNQESVISFSHVSKDFPGVKALDDISFEVQKGRVHGFLGPNGAGKTTTMNILTGLIPPREGEVYVCGHNVIEEPLRAREKVGFLPENPPLYDSMSVTDYLVFVDNIHRILPKKNEDPSLPQADVEKVINSCGLEKVKGRLIGNLSKGYRQRVGIAQALVFNPEIIVLDEPTIGLDPSAIVEIRKLIRELGKERTVLLSSHLLHEVELLCDDITIIREGHIVQSGTLESVQENFRRGLIFKVQVESWDAEKEQKLYSHFPCQKVEYLDDNKQKKNGVKSLELYLSTDKEDLGKSLSRFFVESDCGLLHFEQEQMDLEEIFHLATGGDA